MISKYVLATNWWQLWLHWRQWQISKVSEVVCWIGSLHSVWDNTLRTVLVALQQSRLHQRWRQEAIYYTVQEAPSCQIKRNWTYRYGNWPYRYRNWPYRYRNWPYRYTDYSTPSAVKHFHQSMQSPTHIECSWGFLSQETGTNTFSSSHAKFQQFFPWSISLARVAFSLVNPWNVFPLCTDASTWLLPSDLFRTYSRGEFLTKQTSVSRATLCAACENRVTNLHKPIFACHNLACKPPQNAPMRATLGHFQTARLWANSGQTESAQNGDRDRGWSARHQQLAVIMYIHIQLFSANSDNFWEWPRRPSKSRNSHHWSTTKDKYYPMKSDEMIKYSKHTWSMDTAYQQSKTKETGKQTTRKSHRRWCGQWND